MPSASNFIHIRLHFISHLCKIKTLVTKTHRDRELANYGAIPRTSVANNSSAMPAMVFSYKKGKLLRTNTCWRFIIWDQFGVPSPVLLLLTLHRQKCKNGSISSLLHVVFDKSRRWWFLSVSKIRDPARRYFYD